jgi:hypothetical protein
VPQLKTVAAIEFVADNENFRGGKAHAYEARVLSMVLHSLVTVATLQGYDTVDNTASDLEMVKREVSEYGVLMFNCLKIA